MHHQAAGVFDELLFLLACWAWTDSVLFSNYLDPLATSDRFHGEPGCELRAWGMPFIVWPHTLYGRCRAP